ncbi:hypothetical protein ACOMHN_018541 [Nucella lapillus]
MSTLATETSADLGLNVNTTLWADEWDIARYTEYQATRAISKIWPPFTLLLGGFGNIATIFVMSRIKDHNSSQHAILMSLAVADLTLLYSATLHAWLKHRLDYDLQTLHTVTCKLFMCIIYLSGCMSAWLVTCVTVQRTMAVLWPHRMRVMCTVRRTWIVIAILVLVSFALTSHTLVGMDIVGGNCRAMPGVYELFFNGIYSWVSVGMFSVFPIICLFLCDVILSATLLRAASSSFAARVDVGAQSADTRRKISYRTTGMVLAISCAFLVLTVPVGAFVIWEPTTNIQHPKAWSQRMLFEAIVYNLWYTNSAINFFLYCLTGTKFRREFMRWIRCGAQSLSAPSVHETASEASRGGRHKHHGNSPLSK